MSRPASSLALALLLCGAVHAGPRMVLAPEGAWVAVFNARVVAGGKPEVWNHRQIDAHALFFIAVAEALQSRSIEYPARGSRREQLLRLWPRFLAAVDFSKYEDAGAWEELPRRNTSSIALAT